MKKLLVLFLLIFTFSLCFAISACSNTPDELFAPQNVRIEGRTVVWDEVENATEYIVIIQDKEYTTKECSFDLSTVLTEFKTYEVEVMANNKWLGILFAQSQKVATPFIYEEPVAHGFDEAGYEYTLVKVNDVIGYEINIGTADWTGHITLPNYFKCLPVVNIGKYMFRVDKTGKNGYGPNPFTEAWCNKDTTGVTLPTQLQTIGDGAFEGVINMKDVIIPDSVTEIGVSAFYACKNLKSVKLPQSLKKLGMACFQACNLNEVTLPESLEVIENLAFSVEVRMDVINNQILDSISNTFTKLVIPDSVKSIGTGAFSGCLNLSEIVLPKNLDNLKMEMNVFTGTAWYDAQPEGLTALGNLLYDYKGDVPQGASITIPSTIKYIAGGAFTMQNNLVGVYVPDGIKIIGPQAFSSCDSLEEIRLPTDLTEIPANTFTSCKSLTAITIPNTVTSIGENAFRKCSMLKSVVFSENLKTIGDSAFQDCVSLDYLELPIGLKTLGKTAFLSCSQLVEIVIPASLESLGSSPLANCSALRGVHFEGTKAKWDALIAQNNEGKTNAFSRATIYTK